MLADRLEADAATSLAFSGAGSYLRIVTPSLAELDPNHVLWIGVAHVHRSRAGPLEHDGVLVLEPTADGHEATLYLLPRSNRENGEFWLSGQGELWVGRRHSLTESEALYGIRPYERPRDATEPLTLVPPPADSRVPAWLRKTVRDRINVMLEDGFTYKEIIQELGEEGKWKKVLGFHVIQTLRNFAW